jgi:hypothetical protein
MLGRDFQCGFAMRLEIAEAYASHLETPFDKSAGKDDRKLRTIASRAHALEDTGPRSRALVGR